MAVTGAPAESALETLKGIALMTLAVVMFALLDATAKFLGQYIPAIEAAWFRFATHVLLVFLVLRGWRHVRRFKPNNLRLQTLRGLAMCAATGFNFAALQYLQLAQAVAIMFAAPLLVTALAGPILGEWAGWRRWAAVAVGFVGVLITTRPGVADVHWAVGLSVCSMVGYAFYLLLTRRLGGSENTASLLMWPGVIGTVVFLPIAAPVYEQPEPWLWALLPLLGVFGAFGHFILILAHKKAPASVLAPFTYTQMIWMIVLGYVIFGDVPDLWTVAGSVIIAGSGLYILHRERVRGRPVTLNDPAVQ